MFTTAGQAGRIPFLPRLFTLAAAFENVDLLAFYQDPTLCTNTLFQTWGWLRYDGVFAYHDETLLAEACGAPVTWTGDGFALAGPAPETLPEPAAVLAAGRLPVALEVTRRLAAQLRGEAILAVLVPGPWHLAAQLTGAAAAPPPAALEASGRVLQACARAFLEAGVDLIWVSEPAPAASPQGPLRAMTNLAGFFRKGLVVERSHPDGLDAFLAAGCAGVAVPCAADRPAPAEALVAGWPHDRWLGLGLPVPATGPDPTGAAQCARLGAAWAGGTGGSGGIFWTTAAEIRGWTAEQFGALQEMIQDLA